MTDEEIAAEIQRRGLEIEYLSELATSLGCPAGTGWTDEVLAAIERASPEHRREAALRTIQLAGT